MNHQKLKSSTKEINVPRGLFVTTNPAYLALVQRDDPKVAKRLKAYPIRSNPDVIAAADASLAAADLPNTDTHNIVTQAARYREAGEIGNIAVLVEGDPRHSETERIAERLAVRALHDTVQHPFDQ